MKLRYFEGSVTFVQKVKFTQPNYHIDAYLEYGACNDQNCMPPSEAGFKRLRIYFYMNSNRFRIIVKVLV
jgi:hypothetical protein